MLGSWVETPKLSRSLVHELTVECFRSEFRTYSAIPLLFALPQFAELCRRGPLMVILTGMCENFRAESSAGKFHQNEVSSVMKIALLGAGKTGSEVLRLTRNLSDVSVTAFDIENPPKASKLDGYDAAISFLPGEPFLETIPELLETDLPVITGSTGFTWPGGRETFSEKLRQRGLIWVHANNFSIGMNIMHEIIRLIGRADSLYDEWSYSIHEVHHTKKKDAPSGTALAWKQWLDKPVEITSERTGDVIGEHSLTLSTPFENITVTHSARDRQIFASGALWTARQVLADRNEMEPGLYDVQQIALSKLWNSGPVTSERMNRTS